MLEKEDVRIGLEGLAAVMGTKLTEARIDAYYGVLRKHFAGRSEWQATVTRACEECERFPPPKVLLALRPPGERARHSCSLCTHDKDSDAHGYSTPGFVYTSRIYGKRHLSPCPNRTDGKAAEWYAEKADREGLSVEEARQSAEASALAFSREEAEYWYRTADPEGRMLSRRKPKP
jgi:hypothetical protein